MLLLLAGSLTFMPSRPRSPEAALADRINALESRIARIENEELRSLMAASSRSFAGNWSCPR
jgi:hypothetical protein